MWAILATWLNVNSPIKIHDPRVPPDGAYFSLEKNKATQLFTYLTIIPSDIPCLFSLCLCCALCLPLTSLNVRYIQPSWIGRLNFFFLKKVLSEIQSVRTQRSESVVADEEEGGGGGKEMKIFVKTLKGTTFDIEVKPEDTVCLLYFEFLSEIALLLLFTQVFALCCLKSRMV